MISDTTPNDMVTSVAGSSAPISWGMRLQAPPQSLTPLVGREHDLVLVQQLIADGARLITLTGPPGVGKTRLASQVGIQHLRDFRDGVVWIPLSHVQHTNEVIPTIARHLGMNGIVDARRLGEVLQQAQVMLLLDNLEQLTDIGGELVTVLEQCPKVVMVATSRMLLRVSGEYTIRLQPLQLPEFTRKTTPADLLNSTAVRLFIDRARAIDPGFEITDETVWMVADVCSRVEGLPLAIELLVARLAYLPLSTLRDGMQQRLPFLTSTALDRPSRQRTMRNAIAWSYDLLSPDEQFCFRTLAIHIAGFRLDALVQSVRYLREQQAPGAVVRDDDVWSDALEMVASLSNHSLLRSEVDPDGAPRYRMLEILREFALERLQEAGEAEVAEQLRGAYMHNLAETCETAPFVPGGGRLLSLMDIEMVDIREAMEWWCERGEWEIAQDVAGRMAQCWTVRGHLRDCREWLERILTHCPPTASVSRVRALAGLGMCLHLQAEPEAAQAVLTEALSLGRDMGPTLWTAVALVGNGVMATWRGEFDAARSLLREARAMAPTLPESALVNYVESTAIANLAVVDLVNHDLDSAHAQFLAVLDLRQRDGYELGICRVLNDLGVVSIEMRQFDQALDYLVEAMRLAEHLHESRAMADVMAGMTRIAIAHNELASARRLHLASVTLQDLSGIRSRRNAARVVLADADMDALLYDECACTDLEGRSISWPMDEALMAVEELRQRLRRDDLPARATVAYGLTPREIDVLREVARHQTDREIAEILFISKRTVGFHVTSILKKLGVESRRMATSKAISEQLVS